MALMSTLQDSFSGTSYDATKWSGTGTVLPWVAGGTLHLSTQAGNTNYNGLNGNTTYDLTGSFALIKLIDPGNQTLDSFELYPLILNKDFNVNNVHWAIARGVVTARKRLAGSNTDVTSAPFNAAVHKWFRIREQSGTTYWDYSTDGNTWTNFASQANPFAMTALTPYILVGTWQAESVDSYAELDNFNITPAVTPTSSTDEYWDIDGVSLHQYGWSVTTFGGSRYDLPPRRGDNVTLPYRPGQVPRVKYADARTISLVMWLTGMDPATGQMTYDQTLRFNDSWDFLRRLVWKPYNAPVALTRRWNLTIDGTPTLVAATAQAEIADTMAPTMTGRTRADFTMTLSLPDPYFYGAQSETTVGVAENVTITNPGHDVAGYSNFTVDFVGPLTNPRLYANPVGLIWTGTRPGPWVQYTGSIASGAIYRLDVANFLAFNAATGTSVIGGISNAGARHWLTLDPGDSLVSLAATGTGHAVLRFQPPYI
jgi:hypothetical protein